VVLPAKGTVVCGNLRLAQEWTSAGSPYYVTGDIFVPATSRLRIGPNVDIRVSRFPKPCPEGDPPKKPKAHKPAAHEDQSDSNADKMNEGKKGSHQAHEKPKALPERGPEIPPPPADFSDSTYVGITIEGAFYCIGEPGKPIRFLPADTVGEGIWDGVRLLGQRDARAEIAFTEFHGANVGVYSERSDFTLHHNLFQGNNTGISLGKRGDILILNCVFARNRSAGILMKGASPHIVNSIFWRNFAYGILSDGRKTMTIEYNAFWENGDEDCYRCPHPVMPIGESNIPDTLDVKYNRRADPVFLGSESWQEAMATDPKGDTPNYLAKDSVIAIQEKAMRWKFWKKKPPPPFKPRGQGPYVLSQYSRLSEVGHPARALRNADGKRGDLGIWGGPQTRITVDPFLGL